MNTNKDNRKPKWIRWIARILGTLILIIVLIFLIGYGSNYLRTGIADPYAVEDYPPIENLPPLFMLLSALGLGIAWRWERLGGAIAVFFQLATLPILLIHWPISEGFPFYLFAPYGISALVALTGVLFLVSWRQSKEKAAAPDNT